MLNAQESEMEEGLSGDVKLEFESGNEEVTPWVYYVITWYNVNKMSSINCCLM